MRNVIIVLAVVLAVVGALVFRGLTGSSDNNKKLANNVTIIDVRTQEEYDTSHVSNAQLFPVETMQTGQMPALAKDAPIAVYCRSGRRASEAVTLMKRAGFTNVTSLGGLSDIASYGLSMTN